MSYEEYLETIEEETEAVLEALAYVERAGE